MARIAPLPPEAWTEEFRDWFRPEERQAVELDVTGILARAPRSARAFYRFAGTVQQESGLPGRLLELVRLRVAFFNQCRSCMAVRYPTEGDAVTDQLVCSLERPEQADDLSDAERAALHYAELMATDHLAVGDEVFDRLRQFFTDDQIVSLGFHVALAVGMGRFAATWRATDHLPERFHADGVVTPWGSDQIVLE
jgi:alkylhydroperoxidase family enzyme